MVDVSNIGTGNIQSTIGNIGTGITSNLIYVEIFIVLLVVLGILLYINYVLSFKHLVIVEEKLTHGVLVSSHRGKIVYNKKYDPNKIVERLSIFGVKQDIMIPVHMAEQIEELNKLKGVDKKKSYIVANKERFENLFGINRKGKLAIRMLKDGNEFTVIPFLNQDVAEYLKESNPVRKQWTIQMLRERDEMFKPTEKTWMKLLPFIAIGAILITMVIVFALLFNKFDKLEGLAAAEKLDAESRIVMAGAMGNTTNAINAYAEALNNFADNAACVGGTQIVTATG